MNRKKEIVDIMNDYASEEHAPLAPLISAKKIISATAKVNPRRRGVEYKKILSVILPMIVLIVVSAVLVPTMFLLGDQKSAQETLPPTAPEEGVPSGIKLSQLDKISSDITFWRDKLSYQEYMKVASSQYGYSGKLLNIYSIIINVGTGDSSATLTIYAVDSTCSLDMERMEEPYLDRKKGDKFMSVGHYRDKGHQYYIEVITEQIGLAKQVAAHAVTSEWIYEAEQFRRK